MIKWADLMWLNKTQRNVSPKSKQTKKIQTSRCWIHDVPLFLLCSSIKKGSVHVHFHFSSVSKCLDWVASFEFMKEKWGRTLLARPGTFHFPSALISRRDGTYFSLKCLEYWFLGFNFLSFNIKRNWTSNVIIIWWKEFFVC